jgi:hypothetical protein
MIFIQSVINLILSLINQLQLQKHQQIVITKTTIHPMIKLNKENQSNKSF